MSERTKPYSVAALAAHWDMSRETVYAMIRRGQLRSFRAGDKLLRISVAEVERWESGENTQSDHIDLDSSTGKLSPSGASRVSEGDAGSGSAERRARGRRERSWHNSLRPVSEHQ